MTECKHEIKYLIGDKDGILCQNCGARFESFDEIKKDSKPVAKRGKKKAEGDDDAVC